MKYAHLIFFAIACFGAQNASAQSVEVRPHCAAEPLRLTEVKWTDGFWKQRLDTCRDKTVPAMWEIMRGTKYKPYLEHFRIAAGLSEGTYRGAPFNDGDFYKSCANIGNALWNWRMFLASGDAKYIDVMELALYNSVLSGVSLNGTGFSYTNPLRVSESAPVDLRWSRTRVPFVTSFCCPPNVVRTIAQVSGYAYGKSDNTIWVNLYGNNTLDTRLANGSRVRLDQRTVYPWNGKVQITVAECDERPMVFKLRIPGWAKSATLKVDGEPFATESTPGTYASLERTWQPGTVIELNLPMPVQLIESHPWVEETRNHLAVKRGPIVYCLESVDLPERTSVADVRIPADVKLQPRFDTNLLSGVTILEGELAFMRAGDWQNKLYREFKRPDAIPIPVTLVPYYTWSNRGVSEMSVWLPLN